MSQQSFIDALYAKYCDDGSLDVVELPQADGHRRVCEYVGFEKVRQELKNIENLQVLDLSCSDIGSCCSPDFEPSFQLKRAWSINLSRNQIQDWLTISKIVELAPNLQELVLSSNPLPPPSNDEIQMIGTKLSGIRIAILGDLKYSWNDLLACIKLFPKIERLSLFENQITDICIPSGCLENLKFLSLSKNPITDWNEVCKLGRLNWLETLEMPSCRIELIRFEGSPTTNLFINLKYLDLSYNFISDWRSVAELNKLVSLKILLLKKNPFYDANPYYYTFNHILGRIKNIEKLDREPISKEMRNDGEKYYLRTIYAEYVDKNPEERLKFLEENPRFTELLEKLGEPIVAKKMTKEEMIKQNFLSINVCDPENPDPAKRNIKKQIPVTMDVSNLKFILRRLLKIDLDQEFRLVIKSDDYEEEMEDQKRVSIYRVDKDSVVQIQRL